TRGWPARWRRWSRRRRRHGAAHRPPTRRRSTRGNVRIVRRSSRSGPGSAASAAGTSRRIWGRASMNVGKVVQIIGPVVDVQCADENQPAIYNAVRITSEGFDVPVPIDVTAEVEQHLGEGRVRCVAMEPTDGMVRGMKAYDTDAPIQVPVGKEALGRV